MQQEIAAIADALRTIASSLESLSKKSSRQAALETVSATEKPKRKANKTANGKPAAILDIVLDLLRSQRKKTGISTPEIMRKTGLDNRQVSNAIYKLTKAGAVSRLDRGLYVAIPKAKKTDSKRGRKIRAAVDEILPANEP